MLENIDLTLPIIIDIKLNVQIDSPRVLIPASPLSADVVVAELGNMALTNRIEKRGEADMYHNHLHACTHTHKSSFDMYVET